MFYNAAKIKKLPIRNKTIKIVEGVVYIDIKCISFSVVSCKFYKNISQLKKFIIQLNFSIKSESVCRIFKISRYKYITN